MNAATNHADETTVAPEIIRRLMTAAVAATIVLTAIAFWLSYAHLHDVADGHGLNHSRAWAWPATIDLFIVIGEISILVANLMRRTDTWAIFVTVVGSVGSIALNVAGVGSDAAGLNYVVAAVPPSGALLAFGLLMRQLKAFLTRRKNAEPTALASTETPTEAATESPAGVDGTVRPVATEASRAGDGTTVGSSLPVATESRTSVDETATEAAPSDAPPVDGTTTDAPASDARPVAGTPTTRRRKPTRSGVKKKAPRRSLDEWVTLAGPIFHDQFRELRRQPTANEFAQAIEKAGHGLPSDTVAKTIRAEILDRAEVPALTEGGL
jgi:hypothetical protein